MSLLDKLIRKTEKIDFKFPNDFNQLMNDKYYDYEKFEMFLLHTFKIDNADVQRVAERGKGDSGADLIVTQYEDGKKTRIGIQAKYWKNRVGVSPVRQLTNTKTMLGLDALWIITTSDLTPDAQREAERLSVKVLRKEDVENFIFFIKEKHRREMDEKGESTIEFLPLVKEPKINKVEKDKVEVPKDENYENMRRFRQSLAKKYKVGAVYHIFNNEIMESLLEAKPKTIKELEIIKGVGPVTIEKYGEEIIEFLNNKTKPTIDNSENEFREFLRKERIKISMFNKISIDEVFNDKVLENLIFMKPVSLEVLGKVFGITQKNIDLFGDYLVRQISNFLKGK